MTTIKTPQKKKSKLSLFFMINATILVITMSASILLWIGFITRTWPTNGWDDRILFLFFPAHGLAMIGVGAKKLWRIKKSERKTKDAEVRGVPTPSAESPGEKELEANRERIIKSI